MGEDKAGDARRVVRKGDRDYPGNAKRSRVWPYALGLPLAVIVVWGAVVLYQQVFGTDSRDPLTLNTKARDVVISQPQPDGWARGQVELVCPGKPDDVCVGGGFREVGYVVTQWSAPPPVADAKPRAAADAVCGELARHLGERSTAPQLDIGACRNALLAAEPTMVLGWAEPRGEWVVETAPDADTPSFTVAFRPAVPGD